MFLHTQISESIQRFVRGKGPLRFLHLVPALRHPTVRPRVCASSRTPCKSKSLNGQQISVCRNIEHPPSGGSLHHLQTMLIINDNDVARGLQARARVRRGHSTSTTCPTILSEIDVYGVWLSPSFPPRLTRRCRGRGRHLLTDNVYRYGFRLWFLPDV